MDTEKASVARSTSGIDDIYQPGHILVTGGAGFIASHVAIRLAKLYPGTRCIVFDKLDYCANLRNLDQIKDLHNFKFIKGDICSADLVNYVLETEHIDTILHFAAQTHVDNSFGNSFTFTQNNVMGTHVLLEASKRLGTQIRRFVHVSTDEVYGETLEGQGAFTEQSVLEPTNPYAATKAAAEFLAKAYARSFNLPVIITRGNNVYGPHQFPEKLVPKFMNQMMRDLPLTIHGKGATTRNYLYVQDVAEAFAVIVQRGKVGRIYNIGCEHEISVLNVAKDILKLFGRDNQEEKYLKCGPDRSFNDQRYHIDSTALLELGWKPQVSWEEGLRLTFEWYKDHKEHWGNVDGALVAHPRMTGTAATFSA